MDGLLGRLTDKVKQQYQQGLLNQILTNPSSIGTELGQLFNPEYMSQVKPMTQEQALDLALNAPMMAGTIKPIVKTSYEIAQDVAQKNAALPVSKGGLGLPANNTAMDRAKAMNAEFGWAHGSQNPNITEFLPSKTGAEGPGIYATNYLPESNAYASDNFGATVYPIAVMKGKSIDVGKENPYEFLNAKNDVELLANLKSVGKDSIIKTQEATPQWLINAGGLPMPNRQHYVSINPANFRSRFAAFDPFRRNEADILAGMAAVPVGLLTDNKKKDKKK